MQKTHSSIQSIIDEIDKRKQYRNEKLKEWGYFFLWIAIMYSFYKIFIN